MDIEGNNMSLLQEFIFDVEWYSDWEDKEKHNYGLVMGTDQTDVMTKIAQRLPNISHIEITQYSEFDFVWLNKHNYELLKDEENEYMLDKEEE